MNLEELSPDEQELYMLVALNKSDEEIAQALQLDPREARWRVLHFFEKHHTTKIGVITSFVDEHFCDGTIPHAEYVAASEALAKLSMPYRKFLAELTRQWLAYPNARQDFSSEPNKNSVGTALGVKFLQNYYPVKPIAASLRVRPDDIANIIRLFYIGNRLVPYELGLIENRIYRLIQSGFDNKEIAINMDIPYSQVTTAVRKIYRKLDKCRFEIMFDFIDHNSPGPLLPLEEFEQAHHIVSRLPFLVRRIAAAHLHQWQQYISVHDYSAPAPDQHSLAAQMTWSRSRIRYWLLGVKIPLAKLIRLQYMANLYPIITMLGDD